MNAYSFVFANASLEARADGTLYWPSEQLLCVSDLHLGKSERMARRGGALLPPYETEDTLWRLDAAISDTDPDTVICLGDSFDDLGAAQAVDERTKDTLSRLQAGRDWIWIEGNHDPGPVDLGGTHRFEVARAGLTFRHIATPDGSGEISGHYHPKVGVPGTARRPCFLMDQTRLILPAFGTYTGGLSAGDTALRQLMSDDALAILTGQRATPVPLAACLKR
ncbi:MAG: ligase-associated DNA damage response endonuclease PdeM [Pseudomonadota bacterium]